MSRKERSNPSVGRRQREGRGRGRGEERGKGEGGRTVEERLRVEGQAVLARRGELSRRRRGGAGHEGSVPGLIETKRKGRGGGRGGRGRHLVERKPEHDEHERPLGPRHAVEVAVLDAWSQEEEKEGRGCQGSVWVWGRRRESAREGGWDGQRTKDARMRAKLQPTKGACTG